MQRPKGHQKCIGKLEVLLQEKLLIARASVPTSSDQGTILPTAMHIQELDKDITVAKLEAECQCKKIKTGRYSWTPELTQAIMLVLYWKAIAKR